MIEKTRIFESDTMSLPPLRVVLGDVPSPDPERRLKIIQQPKKPSHEMVIPVKRLIAHLKSQER